MAGKYKLYSENVRMELVHHVMTPFTPDPGCLLFCFFFFDVSYFINVSRQQGP